MGNLSTSASGKTLRIPLSMDSATLIADKLPLNESGATNIFKKNPSYKQKARA